MSGKPLAERDIAFLKVYILGNNAISFAMGVRFGNFTEKKMYIKTDLSEFL